MEQAREDFHDIISPKEGSRPSKSRYVETVDATVNVERGEEPFLEGILRYRSPGCLSCHPPSLRESKFLSVCSTETVQKI